MDHVNSYPCSAPDSNHIIDIARGGSIVMDPASDKVRNCRYDSFAIVALTSTNNGCILLLINM